MTNCRALLLSFIAPFFITSALAGSSPDSGWKPLFNGTNLDGWHIFLRDQNERNKDSNRLVQVRRGEIHMYPDAQAGSDQPFGYISTDKEFTSYHLRLQYKWGEKKFAPRTRAKRDSGLLYHVVEDRVWPRSVECQIQEDDTGDIWAISTRITAPVDPGSTNIIPTVSTNRATGVVRTNQNAMPVFLESDRGGVPFVQNALGTSLRIVRSPANEVEGWNTVEVIVRGDTAVHIVNGRVNNRCYDIRELVNGAWVPLTKGRIALQLEGAEVLFRSIEIKELPE